MNDYIFFMHDDAPKTFESESDSAWERYFAMLQKSGRFTGGSAIGQGICVTKSGTAKQITSYLTGYIRVQANNIEDAKMLLEGNPVFEAGGTIEIRELPRDG